MGHDTADIETRLSRCEVTLYGREDSSTGLSSRMKLVENAVSNIDATLKKIAWLIIAGVVVGILNLVLNKPGAHAPSQSTSVITGEAAVAPAKAALIGTHREYLTTADVAALENVSVREVQDMILSGEIQPAPVKDGREYRIAATYRILPHPAATCGEEPQ